MLEEEELGGIGDHQEVIKDLSDFLLGELALG